MSLITPQVLGSRKFRNAYGLRYAYVAGAMYKGISSVDLVTSMGRAGLIGYFGTGGLKIAAIEKAVVTLQSALSDGQMYGMNLLHSFDRPQLESATADLFLRHGVRFVEAAAYTRLTPGLLRYRLTGLRRSGDGVHSPNRVLAKVSRPEIAELFMRPAPQSMVEPLVASGQLTPEEGALSQFIPVAGEICVEADSGGHTDRGIALVLMPTMLALRDRIVKEYRYPQAIQIGEAGGIGTPHAAAAAFVLGADFVLTGSVNQCTVEAGISDAVKDILQTINVQDTDYAPAGDMFEFGSQVQVLKKGVLFPMRANKLYELYRTHPSLESIEDATRKRIEQSYFKKTIAEIWDETKAYYQGTNPSVVEQAEKYPKKKMALVFRWYFVHSTRSAAAGDDVHRSDFQVHCGPALGAFNQWVKGSEMENWRSRKVADIAERMMYGAASLLTERLSGFDQSS